MNETALSRKVQAHIKEAHGGLARKVHGNAYGVAGEPDIDACIRGRAVKIELKVAGKKPSALQFARLRAWAEVGALAGWATSLEQVDALLSHVDDLTWENPQLAR